MTDTAPLSDDGLAILLFHGVIERQSHPVRNYLGKHLEQVHFVAMLRWLLEHGHVMSMDDVVACRVAGVPFPPRSFAVTFDDGFENNHRIAAPILADMNVPATFYVTTDFVDRNQMSWIDRIEHAIENTRRTELRLPWIKTPVQINSTAGKIACLELIRGKVKRDRELNIDALIASVFEQTDVASCNSRPCPLDQKMNWAQVRSLSDNPLFTIGGHGHSHAILAFLSDDQLSQELDTSLRLFSNHGLDITHFAYPEGQAQCYSPGVIAGLKSRGIVCAPTAMPGFNTAETDLFELTRIMPTPHSLSWLSMGAPACAE